MPPKKKNKKKKAKAKKTNEVTTAATPGENLASELSPTSSAVAASGAATLEPSVSAEVDYQVQVKAKLLQENFNLLLQVTESLTKESTVPLHTSKPVTMEMLTNAAQVLSHSVLRYALFLEKDDTFEAIVPQTQTLATDLTAVCALIRGLLPNAGETLTKEVTRANQALLEAVKKVVLQMRSQLEGRLISNVDQIKSLTAQLTGAVTAECNALAQLSCTNSMATGKKILHQLEFIKDAQSEFDNFTLQEDKADDDDDDNALQQLLDDKAEAEGDGGEPDALGPKAYAVAVAVRALVKFAGLLVKQVHTFILKTKTDDTVKEHVECVERAAAQCYRTSAIIDDFGEPLCHPQDRQGIDETFKRLVQNLKDIVANLISHPTFHTPSSKANPAQWAKTVLDKIAPLEEAYKAAIKSK